MLNDAKARAAKPQSKPYKLTDSHSLFLLVNPSGSKLWRWNYAFDGKQKSMAFGISVHTWLSVEVSQLRWKHISLMSLNLFLIHRFGADI